MARTVKAETLNVGDVIYVKGIVDFSHITRKYEPGTEEFEQAFIRRKMSNPKARKPEKGYTSITILNPSISTKDKNAFKYEGDEIVADIEKMTPLEAYMYESMFKSKNGGWRLSNENKGNLPQVGEIDKKTKEIKLVTPKGELAKGLKVVLVFNVYKAGDNKGVGLQAVLADEPLKYFSTNNTFSSLENLGFTIKDERDQTEDESAEAEVTPTTSTHVPSAEPTVDEINAEDGADDLPWN